MDSMEHVGKCAAHFVVAGWLGGEAAGKATADAAGMQNTDQEVQDEHG